MIEEIARFRLEDVPFTLPGAARDVRPAHARAAAAPPRRGRARRPRLRRDLHADAAARRRPGRLEAARADLGRADRAAHDAAPEPRRGGARATSTPAPRRIALFEIARVYLRRRRRCPTSALRVARRSPRAASCRAKGVVETLYARAQGRAARSSAPSTRCSIPARRRARRAGVVGELHPRAARGHVGRVRARPRASCSRRRTSRSPTRT